VDLEEKTLDRLGDRCEECGAKLTPAELQAAMESGGPALCTLHAEESEPGRAVDEAGFDEGE
jgi:methionyl-tRNA synthetase